MLFRSPLKNLIGHTISERAQPCFAALLARMQPVLASLPKKVPLEIYLQCPDDATREALLHAWQSCWAALGMRNASVSLWPSKQGLMLVDQWLDQCKAADLKKFVLVVAIQLHAAPIPNTAEVAVALLLGWPPLVAHYRLKTSARLHRPVAMRPAHRANDLATMLRWGAVTADDIHDMWQAQLEEADKSAMLQCAGEAKLNLSANGPYSGVHDIHLALGDPGAAASWFAAALACEHAAHTGNAQWLACHEGHVHMAVARPAA